MQECSDFGFFSAQSQRRLRLCGEIGAQIHSPQRRKERRGGAENSKRYTTETTDEIRSGAIAGRNRDRARAFPGVRRGLEYRSVLSELRSGGQRLAGQLRVTARPSATGNRRRAGRGLHRATTLRRQRLRDEAALRAAGVSRAGIRKKVSHNAYRRGVSKWLQTDAFGYAAGKNGRSDRALQVARLSRDRALLQQSCTGRAVHG